MIRLVFTISLLSVLGYTQLATYSPYSFYGVGDRTFNSAVRNFTMGNTGIASFDNAAPNLHNPALLNDLMRASFEISGAGQFSNFKDPGGSNQLGTWGFRHFSFGFSNGRKFALGLGFQPYTVQGYDVRSRGSDSLDGASIAYSQNYTAVGGLNQIFLSGAYKILPGLSLGVQGSYLFGNNFFNTTLDFDDATLATTIRQERNFLNGLNLLVGLSYSDTLSIDSAIFNAPEKVAADKNRQVKWNDRQKFPVFWRIGATVEPGAGLNGDREIVFSNGFVYDTTLISNDNAVKLPLTAGFGIGLHRMYHWNVSADAKLVSYSGFKYFGTTPYTGTGLFLSAGGEYIPKWDGKYGQKIALRGGIFYSVLGLKVEGQDINEYGISLGAGIPLGKSSLSRLNLGVHAGLRGTLASGLQQDQFWRIRVSINFMERWFVQRRID